MRKTLSHFEIPPRFGYGFGESPHPRPSSEDTRLDNPVRFATEDGIAVIEIDNPPVNAASQAVRAGLLAALAAAEADATARAILLCAAGRTFVAGADIREFGKPPQPPSLPQVAAAIEAAAKPVVVALHGSALGGGLELAMAGHYRVALASARMGLPEVTLGILPGAGGTQRLPRLIPMARAAQMITSGKPIDAAEALRLGLIDRIAEGDDIRAAGMALAREIVARGGGPRRTGEMAPRDVEGADFAALRAQLAAASRGLVAPLKALEAVEGAARLPFREGLARERQLFEELLASEQRAALVHMFLAERAAARPPGIADAAPRPFGRLGVVGGGTMGAGIATAALLAGLDVTLVERDAEAAGRAREAVAGNLAGAVSRGKLSAARRDEILARALRTGTDYADLADRELVIEAVFESMPVKHEVFAALDRVCPPGTVLATNTSYLDVDAIAAATGRPDSVLGLHFFSPAHVMKLLEVVVAARTAPEVAATGFALARRLGKVAVRAGVCDGFIGNRILAHYRKALDGAVLAGASPVEVDRALEAFGMAMGPYAVSDLAGLDIAWANRKRLAATRDPRETYAEFADRLCEAGHFGRKTGRGFYIYRDGAPAQPNPDLDEIIAAERRAKGITPRRLDADEIVARFLAAVVNEAARVVADGIARCPADVDVVMVNGYGFPRWRGGPMHHADAVGAARILADIERLRAEDAWLWQPAPLLVRIAAENGRFASLNG
ncbi:MAG: 3-hydroxyacyl-CoA dehydrogenase NAD-binding domain-containing protein [Roseovarius sp.]